jgi:hypothetical protein
MRRMRILIVAAAALLLGVSAARAQTVEVGANWGRGPFNYDEDKLPGSRDVVGVGACIGCDRRRGIFVEYARWGEPHVNQDACRKYWDNSQCRTGYRQADTVASGVRFQGRAMGHVRLFADLGLGFGHSRYERGASLTTDNHVGAAAAVGATMRFDRFYIRGAGQILILSGYYIGARATAGAGWRF